MNRTSPHKFTQLPKSVALYLFVLFFCLLPGNDKYTNCYSESTKKHNFCLPFGGMAYFSYKRKSVFAYYLGPDSSWATDSKK